MGKIEGILEAIKPLKGIFENTDLSYHVTTNRADILFMRPLKGSWGLFVECENDIPIGVFFLLSPHFNFISDRERRMERHEWIAFPIQDFFQYLDIRNFIPPQGGLTTLSSLSHIITTNSLKILNSSTEENVEQTYDALMAMKKDNETFRLFHIPTMKIIIMRERPLID